MAWVWLGIAALFEIAFAMGLKQAHGFTRLWPSLLTILGAVGGLWFLGLAMRALPVSVAYPVWTAAGVLGTVALGAFWLGEALTPLKLVSALLIVLGVAGLRTSV